MLSMSTIERLVQLAIQARIHSYAPYSRFYVGAALLAEDGTVYTGCNIESAAFHPATVRNARPFSKRCRRENGNFRLLPWQEAQSPRCHSSGTAVTPCGVCRQVMAEFCQPTFQIIAVRSEKDYRIFSLQELLPQSFGQADLA